MGRRTLVDDLVDGLLDEILEGRLQPHAAIPPESDIAKAYDVSRLTVREALKALRAQNILYVRSGRGTFVNPTDNWTGLDAIFKAASHGNGADQVSVGLIEVRRMVETGAAALAAKRYTPEHAEMMRGCIADMKRFHEAGDLEKFVLADIAFHDAVLKASGNPFVRALFAQLGQLLYVTRRETSAVPEIQVHAIEYHQKVLDSILTGDVELARRTMDEHMDQTYRDYEQYVHHPHA
ncbi:FadR/GntR family transcriptional regulator [Arthrobacter sp. OV608]|jgi:DNA-binding FadR family transcriptional regulator|uniref:FadR/GntR family transcriptional regulator n=1 Tax=Arthrobacter sp. OV608 TaxID=1882768 RepID=UPI0008D7AEC3|nr:FadR/GntR family transcriptional regulator [Arthrobacter sp. OV608]SEQ94789.1 transcriptional regulator, GntR family [Arthrobacter sp. OV608]